MAVAARSQVSSRFLGQPEARVRVILEETGSTGTELSKVQVVVVVPGVQVSRRTQLQTTRALVDLGQPTQ